MLLHICSLPKVGIQSSLRSVLLMMLGLIGLSEQLIEKLTTSSADPYLQTLKELFINFNGL